MKNEGTAQVHEGTARRYCSKVLLLFESTAHYAQSTARCESTAVMFEVEFSQIQDDGVNIWVSKGRLLFFKNVSIYMQPLRGKRSSQVAYLHKTPIGMITKRGKKIHIICKLIIMCGGMIISLRGSDRLQRKIEAIRIFLAFASYMGFIVYQMDVKSAFLYVGNYRFDETKEQKNETRRT
ncbi:hypothetical protein Tco_0654829 [Tanacetum coccineum]|uniref:Reverse transcriptase Ty1/copia-type domain-containing protein n=1 Tax=Tanacetum coccineum TaxID=301880 RepID=A0ABQ4X4D3_9ASTR